MDEMRSVDTTDLVSRISAMKSQENRAKRNRDYFLYNYSQSLAPKENSRLVDESCRKAMVDWFFKISDAFSFNRETARVATSILDRYLSSGHGNSAKALDDKQGFQLAAITAFYTAQKVIESTPFSIEYLISFCRGFYTQAQISSTELDILFSLEWYILEPTSLDFVLHFLEILSGSIFPETNTILLHVCESLLDYVATDFYFSTVKASTIALACMAESFNKTGILSPYEEQEFWIQLSQNFDFDLSSKALLDAQQRLHLHSSHLAPHDLLTVSLPRTRSILSSHKSIGEAYSPVCVTHTSRKEE